MMCTYRSIRFIRLNMVVIGLYTRMSDFKRAFDNLLTNKYSKTFVKRPLKIDKTKILMTNGS